jgi:signal transduction histidine kinase
LEALPDGYVLQRVECDDQGRPVACAVERVNAAFQEMTEQTEELVVGLPLAEVWPELGLDCIQLYSRVVATGEPVRFETHCPTQQRYIEVVAFSPQPGLLATALSDITQRKTIEGRLRRAAKMEAIGTLASGVAHEINNPINVIMNYASLVLRPEMTREQIDTFAQEIVNESERVAAIVRSLLAFARQEHEVLSDESMGDMLDAALVLVRKVLDHDHIVFSANVAPDLPLLRCRRQQVEQVLINLLTNARYALNERYPGYDEDKQLSVVVAPLETDDGHFIRTVIEDHGTGIAPELMERIFDPFFTTRQGSSGTGLGLSVSQAIVAEHRGRLTVRSEPGAWTKFIVDLPLP